MDPAFGSQATELVHISQAAMVSGGMVDSLVDVVFNDPTLAEAYKVALTRSRNGEPQRSAAPWSARQIIGRLTPN